MYCVTSKLFPLYLTYYKMKIYFEEYEMNGKYFLEYFIQ